MAQPTKKQFLENPRAKELRQVCLDLARAGKAEQERCKNRLLAMGITPKYQAHLEPSAYEDPVTMAEWVAGQWLSYLSELSPEKPLMYTTDETYQNEQQQRAQQTILWVAKRYTSRVHRIEELEWWRGVYQAYGDWQSAMDCLEAQMITWGRKEQGENRELIGQFDLLLKQSSVASTKGEWDEEDYAMLGKARAYSEARYVLQFLPMAEAIDALEQTRQTILKDLEGTSGHEPDTL